MSANALEPGAGLEVAAEVFGKATVSYEVRAELDKNYLKRSAVQAESDRAYAMLGNAIQHHKQMLDNLQVQLDLTTHPEVRERLSREIEEHRQAQARAELEQATLPGEGDQGPLALGKPQLQSKQMGAGKPPIQVKSQQHAAQREALALARHVKEAERLVWQHALTDRHIQHSHAEGAALALGNAVQHEKQLADNLEARLASTTDPGVTQLLKMQIESHREAAARAELEAVSMDGSEQRPNGLTYDNRLVRLYKRALLHADAPSNT